MSEARLASIYKQGEAVFLPHEPSLWDLRQAAKQAVLEQKTAQPYVITQEEMPCIAVNIAVISRIGEYPHIVAIVVCVNMETIIAEVLFDTGNPHLGECRRHAMGLRVKPHSQCVHQ